MKKKIIVAILGIVVVFSFTAFASADIQEEAMNKAEFVSA